MKNNEKCKSQLKHKGLKSNSGLRKADRNHSEKQFSANDSFAQGIDRAHEQKGKVLTFDRMAMVTEW